MRVFVGFVAGIAVAVTASAYAHGNQTTAGSPCIRFATGGGVVCHLPKPPAKQPYAGSTIYVDGIDLRCDVIAATPALGTTLSFSCARTSRPLGRCRDGYDGSLLVAFMGLSTEIDKPSTCVITNTSVGFKDTRRGNTYTFTRAP